MDAGLLQYGALGILALAAVTAVGVLWRKLDEERKARDIEAKASTAKVEGLMTTHRGELTALLERIIEDGRSTKDEYHTLADRSTEALESLAKKLDRAPTRKG